MKGRLVTVILLVVVLGAGLIYGVIAVANSTSPAAVDDPAPDFTLKALDGTGGVSLADFHGEPVLINFFTTWCEPCRSEAPVLQQFEEQYGTEVNLLLIDRAEPAVLIEQFVDEFGLSMTILMDPNNQVSKQYGVLGQPETLVINENGVLRYHQVGEMTLDVMLDLVNRYTNTSL